MTCHAEPTVQLEARRQSLFERHTPSVRRRFELEWDIALALVKSAIGHSYTIEVDYGDDETVKGLTTVVDVMNVLFEADDEHLFLTGGDCGDGWIYLVYGNDGYDVISDYTVNLDPLMDEPDKISNKYCY
jgi:hypothetical protein